MSTWEDWHKELVNEYGNDWFQQSLSPEEILKIVSMCALAI